MKTKIKLAGVLAITLLFAQTVFAHHSTVGRFDEDTLIEISGTVSKISWRNPHSILTIKVADSNGEIASWTVEAGGISQLRRTGVDLDALEVGDTVIIGGPDSLLNKKETFMRYMVITTGGEEIAMMGSRPSAEVTNPVANIPGVLPLMEYGDDSEPELGIYRVWSNTGYTPLYPGGPNQYPLSDAAELVLQAFNPLTDNPTLNCNPKGMPLIMEQPYPVSFIDQGNTILFSLEEYDTRRTIHLDQTSIPRNVPASLLGYSIGHWEGDTLLVTTGKINFPWFNQSGVRLTQNVSLIERFTINPEGSRLDYHLSITDPETFIDPVVVEKHWVYLPDVEVEAYSCE